METLVSEWRLRNGIKRNSQRSGFSLVATYTDIHTYTHTSTLHTFPTNHPRRREDEEKIQIIERMTRKVCLGESRNEWGREGGKEGGQEGGEEAVHPSSLPPTHPSTRPSPPRTPELSVDQRLPWWWELQVCGPLETNFAVIAEICIVSHIVTATTVFVTLEKTYYNLLLCLLSVLLCVQFCMRRRGLGLDTVSCRCTWICVYVQSCVRVLKSDAFSAGEWTDVRPVTGLLAGWLNIVERRHLLRLHHHHAAYLQERGVGRVSQSFLFNTHTHTHTHTRDHCLSKCHRSISMCLLNHPPAILLTFPVH